MSMGCHQYMLVILLYIVSVFMPTINLTWVSRDMCSDNAIVCNDIVTERNLKNFQYHGKLEKTNLQ